MMDDESHDRPTPVSQTSSMLWYVYGVHRATAPTPSESGVDGESVHAVRSGALAALVSVVDAKRFAPGSERSQDVTWLGNQAFAHESVLTAAFTGGAVLPVRFGAVHGSERSVRTFLEQHAEQLLAELDRLDGHSEWSVKALADRAAVTAAIRDAIPAEDSQPDQSEGHAYFARRRAERFIDDAYQERRAAVAMEVHRQLADIASDAVTARAQDPALSGYDGDMVLNGVYLVADTALPALRDALRDLQGRHEGGGITFVVTGPWPPHHFIDVRALERNPAAAVQ